MNTIRRVAILGFSYAEYAACWRNAGAEVTTVETLDKLADAHVAVIVNPNNPDGRLASTQELTALARRMAQRGGLLVIDESFMDFTPQHSVVDLTAQAAPKCSTAPTPKSAAPAPVRCACAMWPWG